MRRNLRSPTSTSSIPGNRPPRDAVNLDTNTWPPQATDITRAARFNDDPQ